MRTLLLHGQCLLLQMVLLGCVRGGLDVLLLLLLLLNKHLLLLRHMRSRVWMSGTWNLILQVSWK